MNPHIGSDFDDFLAEQGLSEDVSAAALKRVIAWQRVKAEAAADEPVAHDAGDLYDPNDPTAVDGFWDAATVRPRGEKHSQRRYKRWAIAARVAHPTDSQTSPTNTRHATRSASRNRFSRRSCTALGAR
ncbi:hypothetical protein SAMN04244579_00320 [Azotobacter beijerinckii]|uniref:Uncharacterized protein n=1 Tax=Azotobacter beijerinckii TaxID=170623 RepID=A0A1H6QQM8_9GAMM|nr:hypothetical protein [Azotobacter beijerinckii]SEI41750.1 hypothetical protein SAMN04244579_00320 [Azotobacter beijerinckii]